MKLLLLLLLAGCSGINTDSCYGLVGRDLEECLQFQRTRPEPQNTLGRDLIPPQDFWR
jgi:hypothetical protein